MTTVEIDWQQVATLSRAYAGGGVEAGRLALHQGEHTLDVRPLEALPLGAGTVIRARQQSAALAGSLSALGVHLGEDAAVLARTAALGALAAGGAAVTAAGSVALAWLARFDPSVTSPAPAGSKIDHVFSASLSDLVGFGPIAVADDRSVELAELVAPDGRRTYRATTTVSAKLVGQDPRWSVNGFGVGGNVTGAVDGAVTLTWDFDTAQAREGFLAELAIHAALTGGSGVGGLGPLAALPPRLPAPTARTLSAGVEAGLLDSVGLYGIAGNARFSRTTSARGSQETLSGGYQPTVPGGDRVIDRQMAIEVDRDAAGRPVAVVLRTSTTFQEGGTGVPSVDAMGRRVRVTISQQTLAVEGDEADAAGHLFGHLLDPPAAQKALLDRVRVETPVVTTYEGVSGSFDVQGDLDGVDLGSGMGVKDLHRTGP
jgi:hypothetical protein